MAIEQPKFLDNFKKKAEIYASDKTRASILIRKALHKAEKQKNNLIKIWDDLTNLFRLILAWNDGTYTEIPWKTIVLAIAAMIYFVNPFDVIPDFLSGIGYLDDISIIAFVIKSIHQDLDNFLKWERSLRGS